MPKAEQTDPHGDFRAIFERSSLGMAIVDPATRQFLQVNDAFCRLTGYSEAELLSVRADALNHPEEREKDRERFIKFVNGETVEYRAEKRYVRKDGVVIWISTTSDLLRDAGGRPHRCVAWVQDITERKRTEKQLARNSETFYHLIKNNPFGVYIVDAEFRLHEISRGAQRVFSNVKPLLGRDFAEVLRTVWAEPFATEAICRFRKTLATGEPYVALSTVERRRDIEEVEAYDWRIERITLPDGSFGVVCYFYDLSERQRWDSALRASEQRLRNIFNANSVGLFLGDFDGRVLEANDAFLKTVGYTREDFEAGRVNWLKLTPSEYRHLDERAMQQMDANGSHTPYEKEYIRKDGARVPVLVDTAYLPAEKLGVGIIADLTRRNSAEQHSRHSDFRFRSLVNSVDGIVWECAIEPTGFRFTFVSNRAERLLGYPVERWLNEPNFWREHIHPDDREWALKYCLIATREKRDHEFEYRMINADGGIVWLRDIVTVMIENDVPVRLVGVMVDITAHKEAEAALRSSEERLRRTQTAARLGTWDWNLKTQEIYWSDGLFELVGVPPRSFTPTLEKWQEFIFPADHHSALESMKEVMSKGGPFQTEFRIKRADGQIRWMACSGKVELASDGQPFQMLGVNIDITDRKQIEATLVENQARERAYLEHLPVGVWFLNASGAIIYGNPAAKDIWSGARYVEIEHF